MVTLQSIISLNQCHCLLQSVKVWITVTVLQPSSVSVSRWPLYITSVKSVSLTLLNRQCHCHWPPFINSVSQCHCPMSITYVSQCHWPPYITMQIQSLRETRILYFNFVNCFVDFTLCQILSSSLAHFVFINGNDQCWTLAYYHYCASQSTHYRCWARNSAK